MAQGTPLIFPINIGWNNNGTLSAGAIATFYLAGTTTLVNIYADVALSVPLANPLTADGIGRFPLIYVTPGIAYKVKATDANGVLLDGYPADNIPAVPTSSSNPEVTGTAGETLTAGQVAYLSDGSGSKTPGLWYKADSANAYSSTTNEIGLVPATITAGSSGTIRVGGSIGGLVVSVGSLYYVGSAGAITSTAPANARIVGQADTTTSLVLGAPPPVAIIDNMIVDGRLTLTTAVPVTTADVTGASAVTLYFTPYKGNRLALYNGTVWQVLTFTEVSIAVPATTAQMYDIFAYNNSGTVALEVLAWTNDTARATALVTQDGVLSKTGVLTRRYLGSFRTAGVSGQTEDSSAKRYLWNYYNRVPRGLVKLYAITSYAYTTATVRIAAADTANQIDLIVGVAEVPVQLSVQSIASNDTGGMVAAIGIGYDASATITTGGGTVANIAANTSVAFLARLDGHYPAIGRHLYAGLEWSAATGTTTWYGTTVPSSGPAGIQAGLRGVYHG